MTIKTIITVSCLLLCGGLTSGCIGVSGAPGVGIAATAIKSAVGSPYTPLTNAAAMTNESVVGPQEQMQYANSSCPELKSHIERFQTSSTMFNQTASARHGPDKKAIAMQAMTTRLDYLKKLSVAKKC